MEPPPPGTLALSADVRYCNEKVQEAVRRFLRVDGLRNDGQCHLYTVAVSVTWRSVGSSWALLLGNYVLYCPFGSSVFSSGTTVVDNVHCLPIRVIEPRLRIEKCTDHMDVVFIWR
jgi:hypothetical protein